jgi:signal peptidase II
VAVAIAVLALDQYTKDVVVKHFRACQSALFNAPCDSRVFIPHFLNWTYERNFHGAFGMFGSNAVLLIGMAMVVLVVFWLSFRDAAASSRLVSVAFGMIVGGAIGNIVDRLHYGYVVDFIDFYRIWGNIFNIADSCITVGVALLLLSSLVSRRHH